MSSPLAYTVTNALGQQIPVMPGQTPQQALAQSYQNLGYTPGDNTGVFSGIQDQTNLTPQYMPLYQAQGLQAAQNGGAGVITDPDTGQQISIAQYMANLPQYQQERQSAFPNGATATGTTTGAANAGVAQPNVSGDALAGAIPDPTATGWRGTPTAGITGNNLTGTPSNATGTPIPFGNLPPGAQQQLSSMGLGTTPAPLRPGVTTAAANATPYNPGTPGMPTVGAPTSSNPGFTGLASNGGLTPSGFDWSQVPQIGNVSLPAPPTISQTFDPSVTNTFAGIGQDSINRIGQYYGFNPAQMNAAQINTGNIPQVQAELPQSFDALQFLLSGQGYDPATLAAMKANATDANNMAGLTQAGNARLMAQQAGLGDSGASLALQQQAARNAAAANQQSLNNINIANAQQGIQNLTTGANMQLGLESTDAQLANQVALQNAANLFSGMQQNVQNMQQANLTNQQTQQQQNMAQAGAQSGLQGNLAQMYNSGLLTNASNAAMANANNTINTNLNNAQLQRQQDITNAQLGQNSVNTATNAMVNLTNGTNPNGLATSAAGIGYNPNLIGANSVSNVGNTLTNLATKLGTNTASNTGT